MRYFVLDASKRLLEELRENKRRTIDLNPFFSESLRITFEQNITAQRPSGADLKTFYRELKEIAFLNNIMREGKLLFNAEILNRRFAVR